jgi:hypothetical protein
MIRKGLHTDRDVQREPLSRIREAAVLAHVGIVSVLLVSASPDLIWQSAAASSARSSSVSLPHLSLTLTLLNDCFRCTKTITTIGYGMRQPFADGSTAGRQKNCRFEVPRPTEKEFDLCDPPRKEATLHFRYSFSRPVGRAL